MSRLHLGLYTSPTSGVLLADLSHKVQGLEFETTRHGFGALTGSLPERLAEAFRLYDASGLPHVRLAKNGMTAYEGRLESRKLVAGGLKLSALGYWRALSDTRYTALWSKTDYGGFRETRPEDIAGWNPKMYQMDLNNRLFIGLQKNAAYGYGADVGEYHTLVPSSSSTNFVAASFDYAVLLPANWRARMIVRTTAFGAPVVLWDLLATGAPQSGSQNLSFLANASPMVAFYIYNDTGALSTYAGESGANYLRITNLRVLSTTSASLYADEIARALVSHVNGINASQMQNITALIQSPTLDLRDEVYEDALPADILEYLVGLGDNQTPPRQWEVGVWEDRRLHLRPRGSAARAWFIDVGAPEMERTIDLLRNAVYATYQEAGGRTLRTATSTDAASVTRHGLTRQAQLNVRTTSSAQAQTHRDAYLADRKTNQARGAILAERVYDTQGNRRENWEPRSSDTITVRNLPASLGSELDRLRSFRVEATKYRAEADTIEFTPEAPRPSLELLLARRAAGVDAQFSFKEKSRG